MLLQVPVLCHVGRRRIHEAATPKSGYGLNREATPKMVVSLRQAKRGTVKNKKNCPHTPRHSHSTLVMNQSSAVPISASDHSPVLASESLHLPEAGPLRRDFGKGALSRSVRATWPCGCGSLFSKHIRTHLPDLLNSA